MEINLMATTRPAISPARQYFGKLYERNGEFEYTHLMLFQADDDPMAALNCIAKSFYSDEPDEQDGGYYFFCGGNYISAESVTEITEEEFAVLAKYLN